MTVFGTCSILKVIDVRSLEIEAMVQMESKKLRGMGMTLH